MLHLIIYLLNCLCCAEDSTGGSCSLIGSESSQTCKKVKDATDSVQRAHVKPPPPPRGGSNSTVVLHMPSSLAHCR